jgi:hypothetical protein
MQLCLRAVVLSVPGHRSRYAGAPSGSVLQAYDAAVAAQAQAMTFDFLQRVMGAH